MCETSVVFYVNNTNQITRDRYQINPTDNNLLFQSYRIGIASKCTLDGYLRTNPCGFLDRENRCSGYRNGSGRID